MVSIKEIRETKNPEDFEVVKKYFSKIFTVLPSEIREKLFNLNISEKNINKLKKELAFLPEELQKEYIDEIFKIYRDVLNGY